MSTENKPRVFWLIYEKGCSTWVSDKPLNSADVDAEIHVIEYSALIAEKSDHTETKRQRDFWDSEWNEVVKEKEKLLKENAELSSEIKYINTQVKVASYKLMLDEIAALKSKLAKAKEALEHIQQPFNNETNYIDRAVRAQEKAWDVLREIGEG